MFPAVRFGPSRTPLLVVLFFLIALAVGSSPAQIQIAPPTRQIQPPSPDAPAADLEKQGDELRGEKEYLDAIDYYNAARKKNPTGASLPNKIGISLLMLQRYKDAGKQFKEAIKRDRNFAEAYNNLGVIHYERRKYGAAVKQYKKAIKLQPDSASFYSNLGAAYFARKKYELASEAYAKAVELDPMVFERTSHSGIAAQMASPQDRARYDYIVAKLYARMGDRDRSLQFLRKAMEDGYKNVKDAYTDPEFADLRKDTRFSELMNAKPPAIPE